MNQQAQPHDGYGGIENQKPEHQASSDVKAFYPFNIGSLVPQTAGNPRCMGPDPEVMDPPMQPYKTEKALADSMQRPLKKADREGQIFMIVSFATIITGFFTCFASIEIGLSLIFLGGLVLYEV